MQRQVQWNAVPDGPIERTSDFGSFLSSGFCLSGQESIKAPTLIRELMPALGFDSRDADSRECGAVVCILANLFNGFCELRPVSVSLRKSDYRIPTRYGLGHYRYQSMRHGIELLARQGLLFLFLGSRQDHLRTRIWPTEALSGLFRKYDVEITPCQLRYADELLLKDSEKQLINYKDTRERDRLRSRVRDFNDLMARTRLELGPGSGATAQQEMLIQTHKSIYRVFNDSSWTRGGRFYGGAWQSLPREIRPFIRINGEPVTELDFSALHPSMLYHRLGIPAPLDAYDFGEAPELRPVIKLIVLVGLNASSKKSAIGAIRSKLQEDEKLSHLMQRCGVTVGGLYEKFLQHHAPIESFINSGIGVTLQNWDAAVMARVINHFTKKGVPCLSIHDSAIVSTKYGSELEAVMKSSYKQDFNFDIQIKVQ